MNLKSDQLACFLIGVIAFVVFANTLGHGFVYDDNRQILMNSLIQRSDLYGKALTSDVWAFKGGNGLAASNYFRPTFVAWMIGNWYLFGAAPFKWHLISVMQHVAVCLLLFALLRRFDCDRLLATAIAIMFAVHPAHVESVAWISGATDSLVALFLLGSLVLADLYANEESGSARRAGLLILSVMTFLLAAGAKEIALFCLPLYWLIFRRRRQSESFKASTLRVVPYLAVAVIFFAIRYSVLGTLFLPVEDPIAKDAVLLTVPKVFLFYLQQLSAPYYLAISAPVRAVNTFSFADVILPAVISVAALVVLVYLSRKSFVQKFGLALFLLTILPVLNLSNFGAEQLAHDRYLYLPVAGILMILVPALALLAEKLKKPVVMPATIGVLGFVLALQTVSYNSVWLSSLTLWRHAVTVDPRSAHAWFNLASATQNQNEALNAYEKSLAIRPSPTAIAGKARALIALGDLDGAVETAREAIAADPKDINAYTLFQSYEAETYALTGLGRNKEAEASLRTARERLPIYYGALSAKLAVVLYNENRKNDALTELESARERSLGEELADSKNVLLRLGMLYAELGDRDKARAALLDYLSQTNGLAAVPAADRKQATDLLGRL
jgi:tetratricopeptide (TPR) repeat protein